MANESVTVARRVNLIKRLEESQWCFADNNKVYISGRVTEQLEFSHRGRYEEFYKTKVKVTRFSGVPDYVPIVISSALLTPRMRSELADKWLELFGEIRTYNIKDCQGKRHLDIYILVSAMTVVETEEEIEIPKGNILYLEGYVVKPPIYRKTPLGTEIADLTIAINRSYGKTAYVPCIAWGRDARESQEFKVGTYVCLYGRFQSREYFKRDTPTSNKGTYMTAYEVSIQKLYNYSML